ncbi:MAG TPA: (2Fe-2S)-binding protein [Vicinamibacterales bacterium]|nr:(2Fe-2S)-binding protein [Vicinamibacterales bacterium]
MGKKSGDARTESPQGVSRRSFIQSAGAGAIGAVALGKAEARPPQEIQRPEDMTAVSLTVNGRRHRLLVEPRWSLLYVIRHELGLSGTKVGCERGECGTCTVLIDGVPRYACMTLALEAEDTEVTTVEGLMRGEDLGPVQQAFVERDAFQCGYCTPGQVVAAEGLLRANPHPTLDQIREGMSGNVCRCGSYGHICRAVERAAELRKA